MTTVIVDYGSGNLHSAEKAFQRMGAPLGEKIIVSGDPEVVRRADRIMLPGVGAFGDCAEGLAAVDGMNAALEDRVIGDGAPFLGICVGMQLMADIGRERGVFDGLGWIAGAVDALAPTDPAFKIPHMGWNALEPRAEHPALNGLDSGDQAYFVHSFHYAPIDPRHILATVTYEAPFAAIIGRDNLLGTQFHPEKSQHVGLRLIENFLRWRP